jgi:hypothetical protein
VGDCLNLTNVLYSTRRRTWESCGNAVEIELADLGIGYMYFESRPRHPRPDSELHMNNCVQRKLTVISHVWLLYSAVILMKYSKKIIGLLFHPRPPAIVHHPAL